MSASAWAAVAWMGLIVLFAAALLWYLFLGPGSSRWYRR